MVSAVVLRIAATLTLTLLLSGLLGCGSVVDGPGVWSAAQSMPLGPRQELGAAVIGDEIFVVGGLGASGNSVDRVEAYNTRTKQWREVAKLPAVAHHANVASVMGKIYVAGFLKGGFLADGRIFEYDPASDTWVTKTVLPEERWRGASGCTSDGERIYIIGGYSGRASRLASFYDPATSAVSPLPDLPQALDHLTAQVVGGVVYAIGGRDGGHTSRVFALIDGQWQARSSMPTSRAGLSSAVLDGRVFAFGGEGSGAPRDGVFSQSEVYDPVEDRWTAAAPMLTPRHGAAAAAVDGRIFLIGGGDVQGIGAVDTHEIFTP